MPKPLHFFYIHGFNSSPQSAKATLTKDYLNDQKLIAQYHVPTLPYAPDQAIERLESAITDCLPDNVALIGSSLGGYYGTWIAEKYQLPLVLVNPAVKPYELLAHYLGENTNIYTGEKYTFTENNVQQLKALNIRTLTDPERYLLVTQTGDEVLDYRQAIEKFHTSRHIIQLGGSHGFDHFETILPDLIDFLLKQLQL